MAKIQDCENQIVVVSARSITIKDEYDKTRGVVRNVSNLYDLAPNKQFPLVHNIEQAGLSRNSYWGCCERILIIDNNVCVLADDSVLEIDERCEKKGYGTSKLLTLIRACEACPLVNVVHCKRVFYSNRRK